MTDLTTSYLGRSLHSPIVASASPMTADLDQLARLEDHGVGAVVLPSLFEEQITHESLELGRMLDTGAEAQGEATSYFPELETYNTGPDHYLDLVGAAKGRVAVPVIASLNASTPGGWARYASLIEGAGADALELNVYVVAADPDTPGADIEERTVEIVAEVREAVDLPLAVKISPYWSSVANLAGRVVQAGADGLVLFNRFYQPDLDVESLSVEPRLHLSTPAELLLPLRWLGILHDRLPVSLAASTGVHEGTDVAKALLVGADVAMMTAALLEHGPRHVEDVEAGLRYWMQEHEYDSVEQLRGAVSQARGGDPEAFERANYIRLLASYSSPTR